MVDDLIRLYDKDAKPKTIKTESDKTSTTVLNGSDAENWMISNNAYTPRFYGAVEKPLISLIGTYAQISNNGAVNVMVGNDDKIFYKYSKKPSTDFIKNMFKIGVTDRFTKQIDGTIPGKNLIDPDEYPTFSGGKTEFTQNGITFKKLEDGSVSANGTCTGDGASCQVKIYSAGNNKKYLITGCPSGGSSTTYYIWDTKHPYYDYGDGCVTTNLEAYSIWISIRPGTTVENLIFKPQLYNLTDIFGRDKEPKTVSDFYLKYYCNFAWIDSETFADETKNKYGVMPEVPTAVASATIFDKWLYIKFFDEAFTEEGDHNFVNGASLERIIGSGFGGFNIKFSFYSYRPKIFYIQMFQNEAYVNPDEYDSATGWADGFSLYRNVGGNNICKRFTKAGFEEAIKKYSGTADYKIAYKLDEFGGLYLFCPEESNGGSYKWFTDINGNGDVYDSINDFTRILAGNNITVTYKNVTLKDEWGGLGLGVLSEISSPLVKRELNGEYEFSFTYPVTGRHFNELKPRAIVVTKPSANENPQGFRIYKTTKPINGQITVNCQHISYDQSGIFAIPFATPVSESGSSLYSSDDMISSLIGAASKISPDSEFAKTGRITVEGGKVLVNQQFYSDDPKSLRSLIGADDGSILSILGGDVVFDNFKTTFYPKGYGKKTGFSIRYGKNMTEYSEEEDESGAYSRVYPFWKPKNSTSTSSSNLDNYKINPAYSAGANISGSSNTDSVLSGINGTYIPTKYNPSDFLGELLFKQFLEKELASGRYIDTGKILQSPDGTERYVYDSKSKTIIDANKSTQETAETTNETNYLDLDGYSRIAGTKATIEGEEYVSLLADGRIVVADQENIDNPYFKTMTLDLSDAFENKGLLTYDSIDNFPKPSEITKTQAKCIFVDSSKSRKYLYDPFKDSGTKDKDGHVIYGGYIDYSGTPDKNALYLEAYWYIVENDLAKPKVTFTLSYVELYRNKDTSALSVLEQVNLGDTIKIKMSLYNTDVDVKCTGMSYNPISKRVESITVGTPKKDLASTISEQTEKISKTPDKKTVSTLVDSTIAPALQVTTSLITGNTGGFAMLYNSRTGKTSTTPKATTAWATMNEDGKSGIPFRTYDEMYNFITNLEGGISDDILFKYAPGVKKEDGTYDYTNAPVYDFTWSSRLLRTRIFDIKFINGTGQDEGFKLTFNSILFNPDAWQNSLEYNQSIDGTSYRQYSFSKEYVLAHGSGAKFTATLNNAGSDKSVIFSLGIDKGKDGKACFFAIVSQDSKNEIYESDPIDFRMSQGYDPIKIKLDGVYKDYKHDASENIDDIGVVWASGFEKYNQDVSAPDEFLIMNTNDINTATQVWRWNKSGLMFSKSEKPGDAYFGFNSNIPLAMDMNGQIIAQRINADQLEINDVTVNNGLYLRGKRAEKLFLTKSGFTAVSPAEGSDYIKYHFSDNEEKILPPENEHLTYFSTDFDAKWGDPFEGEIYNKNDEKIADIFLISYSDFITGSGVTSPNRNYAAITDVGDLLFKLYGMDYVDIGSYFSTHTIKIVYPTYNNVSFYSEAGISSIFNGEIYASVLGGAHFDGHGTVSCMIYNQANSSLIDINVVSVEQGTKTKFELKYNARPGKSNIQKPDSSGDFYSWSDSDGGTIPLRFYVKGDPNAKFAYIPVPNTVEWGKNYTGSVVVNYQIGNIKSVRPASSTEEDLSTDPPSHFLVQSPTAIIRLPGLGLKPYMFFKGSLRAYDETSSIGYIDKDTNTENRFSIGCFEVINTNSCIVNNDITVNGITVNDITVNGSISFGPATEGANTPTNINALGVSSRDALVSKIDLTRSAIYNPNGTIKELTDSEGGLIKFPFIDGQNNTLHVASGGAFYIGFSEYNFTSGAATVKLPCLVIYQYLNGAWRPKYRFRLSDIANYDDSGVLNGWVPNTAK